MQFYFRQFAGDDAVLAMSLEAVGAHILLMCAAGASESGYSLAYDLAQIRTRLRNPSQQDLDRIMSELLAGAWKISADGTRIEQDGMRRTLEKQKEFSKKQRKNAASRWHKSGINLAHAKTCPSSSPASSPASSINNNNNNNSEVEPENQPTPKPKRSRAKKGFDNYVLPAHRGMGTPPPWLKPKADPLIDHPEVDMPYLIFCTAKEWKNIISLMGAECAAYIQTQMENYILDDNNQGKGLAWYKRTVDHAQAILNWWRKERRAGKAYHFHSELKIEGFFPLHVIKKDGGLQK